MKLKSPDTLVLVIIILFCLVKIWQLIQSPKTPEKSFNYSGIGDYYKVKREMMSPKSSEETKYWARYRLVRQELPSEGD